MFTFFKSIIYGFISACAEIFPISASAHRGILLKLLGLQEGIPFADLLIHIGLLAAIILASENAIASFFQKPRPATEGRTYRSPAHYDRLLLKTAMVPMLLGQLLSLLTRNMEAKLLYVALFLLLNGIILFLQDYASHGNKKANHFSLLESILVGLCSILSIFPGLSRNGLILSYCVLRGADTKSAVNWAILLTVPTLLLLCVFDLVAIITVGFGITSFLTFLYCLLSGIVAFAGGYLSVIILRTLAANTGLSVFSYYSWGAALFCTLLYLIS